MSEFTKGAVLMVLANCYYDISDYIRNYSEFLKIAHNRNTME